MAQKMVVCIWCPVPMTVPAGPVRMLCWRFSPCMRSQYSACAHSRPSACTIATLTSAQLHSLIQHLPCAAVRSRASYNAYVLGSGRKVSCEPEQTRPTPYFTSAKGSMVPVAHSCCALHMAYSEGSTPAAYSAGQLAPLYGAWEHAMKSIWSEGLHIRNSMKDL